MQSLGDSAIGSASKEWLTERPLLMPESDLRTIRQSGLLKLWPRE